MNQLILSKALLEIETMQRYNPIYEKKTATTY